MNKKKIYLLTLFLFFILGLYLITVSLKPFINSIKWQPTVFLPALTPTPSISADLETVKVKRVIDGDTIELTDGRRVRYIGIDAPEVYFQTVPVCFARESYIKNKELVENREVFLEKDVSETDKYGRLLRYVYIVISENPEEKIMINKTLVLEGYARASTFPPDVKYQAVFLDAQIEAKNSQKGLWNNCIFMSSSPVSVSASSLDEINISGKSGTIN